MEKIRNFKITKIYGDLIEENIDKVVVEKLMHLYVNGRHYSTLMYSPGDEKELVIGFLYTAQVITGYEDIISMDFRGEDLIMVTIAFDAVERFAEFSAMTSGCGRGGIRLGQLDQLQLPVVENGLSTMKEYILQNMKLFNNYSVTFKETGGVHGCALFNEDGLVAAREDIGRHNAMDKVIGAAIIMGKDLNKMMILSTGRVSVDMVVKVAVAGIPIIVSHSAPTSFAVELCLTQNITLAGFVRGNRMNVYCNEFRIQ